MTGFDIPQDGLTGLERLTEQAKRQKAGEDVAFMSSFSTAVQRDPDLAAETKRLQIDTGLDPQTLGANIDKARELARIREARSVKLAEDSPVLRRQLEDPEFAALAHDHLSKLSAIELFMGSMTAGQLQAERGRLGTAMMRGRAGQADYARLQELDRQLADLPDGRGWIGGLGQVLGQMLSSNVEAGKVSMVAGTSAAGVAALAGQLGPQAALPEEVVTVPAAFLAAAGPAFTTGLALDIFKTEGGSAYLDYLQRGYDPGHARMAATAVGAANAVLELTGLQALGHPAVRGAVSKIIRRDVSRAVTRLTPSAAALRALKEYATGVAGEATTEGLQQLTQALGEEYSRAHTSLLGPQIAAGGEGAYDAPGGGRVTALADGAIEVDPQLFHRITGRTATKPVRMDGAVAQDFLHEVDSQAAQSSAWQRGEVWSQMIDTSVQAAQASALLAIPGPVANLMADHSRLRTAALADRVIEELTTRLKEAPLTERSPEQLDAWLQQVGKGKRVSTLWVGREHVEAAFTAAGWEKKDIRELLPQVADQLDADPDTTPDIRISVGTFARFIGSPLETALRPHLRIDQDGLSADAATKLADQIKADTEAMRAELEQRVEQEKQAQTESDKIEERVYQQLQAAGRFDAAKSRAGAAFYRVILDTMAPRFGLSPAEFEAKFGSTTVEAGTGEARGAMSIDRFTTLLHEDAGIDTWLHETGHFWFETMTQAALDPATPADVRADVETLAKWAGYESVDDYLTTPDAKRRNIHEAFAYSFEKYLYTGEVPNQDAGRLFAKLSRWQRAAYTGALQQIDAQYFDATQEHIPAFTEEVRAVMDRMVASQEQLDYARRMRGLQTLLDEDMLAAMPPAERDALTKTIFDADNADIETLQRVRMRELRYMRDARSREMRAVQSEARDARAKIRAEVAAEQELRPIYRLRKWLETGDFVDEQGAIHKSLTDDEPVSGDTKAYRLSRQAVLGVMPVGTDLRALKKYLVAGKEGVHPEVAARKFGYPSARAMLEEMLRAAPLDEAIDHFTNQRMWAEHEDVLDPTLIEDRVLEALHGDARQRLVAAEMRAFDKALPSVRDLVAAARESARRALAKRSVSSLTVREFSVAAGKANRDALKAKHSGDLLAMRSAQRRALLQHALAKEAGAIRDELRRETKRFARFLRADKDVAKSRSMPIVEAGRVVLSAYGLAKFKRPLGTPDDILAPLKGTLAYDEVARIVTEALDEAKRITRPVHDNLTVEQARTLIDTLDTLWFRAKREQEAMVDGRRQTLEDLGAALGAQNAALGVEPRRIEGSPTWRERAGRFMRSQGANFARMEFVARALDGGTEGFFTRSFVRPVFEASTRARLDEKTYVERLSTMVSSYKFEERGKIETKKEELDGYVFGRGDGRGKAELIGALLHTGNESNLERLIAGYGWGERYDNGSINTTRWRKFLDRMHKEGVLTKADWDFVQSVWDLNAEILPRMQSVHHDLFGYNFKTVDPKPVQTPFGEYPGGYVPAKASKWHDTQAAIFDAEAMLDFQRSLPSVARGFTKERVEGAARPLDLSLDNVALHLHETMVFANMAPAIRDVSRIARDRKIAALIDDADPLFRKEILDPWLSRSARLSSTQHPDASGSWNFLNGFRNRAGIVMMFGKLSPALQNITGIFPALLRVSPKHLFEGVRYALSGIEEAKSEVSKLSPFMRDRFTSNIYELRDDVLERLVGNRRGSAVQKFASKYAYYLQHITQEPLDVAVWRGTYNQELAKLAELGGDEAHAEAVRRADAAVRQTQHTNTPESLAPIEAGSPLMKLFTQFTGWFVNWGNLVRSEAGIRWRNNPDLLQRTASLASLWAVGMVLPLVLADAIGAALAGRLTSDEDKDGNVLDDFAWRAFRSQLTGVASSIPIWGSAGQIGFDVLFDAKSWNSRMPTPPALSMLRDGLAAAGGGKFDSRAVRAAVSMVSAMIGVPVNVLTNPLVYSMAVNEGRTEPANPFDAARGLITGR